MADRRSTAHEVWIGEDDHVWLAAGSWRVDVTQLKAQHDCYREQADSLAHALTMARGFLGMAIKSPMSAAYVADCALEAYEDVRSGGASAPVPPAADREETT